MMPIQGQVFALPRILPPGQPDWYRVAIVSRNFIVSTTGTSFAMIAIVRSANKGGRFIRRIVGHSILVPAGVIQSLPHDSFIETHQLFSIPVKEFNGVSTDGLLPLDLLNDVLEGSRLLFSMP